MRAGCIVLSHALMRRRIEQGDMNAFDNESSDGYEGGAYATNTGHDSEEEDEYEDEEVEQQVRHASRVHRAVSRANAVAQRTWRYESRCELDQFCALRRGLPGDAKRRLLFV